MKKLLLFVAIATMALFSACKKKDVEPEVPVVPVVIPTTVAQKIIAKWGITSFVVNNYYSNADHINTVNGSASEYLDFRSNGKLYINFNTIGGLDTLQYNLVNDSTINIDGDINKIKEITDTKFVIYSKDIYSTNPLEFDEFTINLKK